MGGVIFIVRHGATKLNNQTDMSEDRIRGWTDVPLSDEGRKEAQATALKLKSKHVQAIVASSLSRARETADIIGRAVGVKPTVSDGLRPWNLGKFTGQSTKDALPKLAEYVRNKPDQPVPEGESFDQFKERAFGGLADAIEAHQGKVLVIVTHHRNERLYEAWEKAGRPEDLSIDLPTFLQKGDPPGGIKELKIAPSSSNGQSGPTSKPNEILTRDGSERIGGDRWQHRELPESTAGVLPSGRSAMATASTIQAGSGKTTGPAVSIPSPDGTTRSRGAAIPSAFTAGKNGPSMQNPSEMDTGKVSKAEAHYSLAPKGSEDRCGNCKSFRPPNSCVKVEGTIATAGWCRLGHAMSDGHAFYGDPGEEAKESPAEATAEGDMPMTKPSGMSDHMAHGRAIAGAKALHAVGHISAKERDKYVKTSQAAIGKAKPKPVMRKPFGSFAPGGTY